jgi:ribonuclease HI
MSELIVYTDGGCQPNPGAGGWAFVIDHPEKQYKNWGSEDFTTNNRMEITAALKAIDFIESLHLVGTEDTIKIISDSMYLVKGYNEWSIKWLQNGWKMSRFNSEHVKNHDLWSALCKYKNDYNITFVWCKGHEDTELNNECDRLATLARTNKI